MGGRRVRGIIAAVLALAAATACSSTGGSPGSPSESPASPRLSTAATHPASPATTGSVGTGRALEHARADIVRRSVNHCARNAAAQKVIVSIGRQHLWMCAGHRTVYDTAVTTGMVGPWTSTPTGRYRIEGRNRNTVLTLSTGQTFPVKYWIPFDAPLYGFHDSSWQHFPYGSPRYRTHGSHGCVHMPLKAIAFLYRWVARPTAVRIF